MGTFASKLRRVAPALLLVAGSAAIGVWAVGWTTYQDSRYAASTAISLDEAEKLVAGATLNGLTRAELYERLGKPDAARSDGASCNYFLGTHFSLLFGPTKYYLWVTFKDDVVVDSMIADD